MTQTTTRLPEIGEATDKAPLIPSRTPMCFAHRGARAYAPENTLLAFSMAFDLGAEAIECDVQTTRDDQLVIIHDGKVDRTTDGSGYVAEQTLSELRALDAGTGWRVHQRIPTLDEAFDLVRRCGREINLEIKGESSDQTLATAHIVGQRLHDLDSDLRQRLLVSSFDHSALRSLKEHLPWLRVAALFGDEWNGQDLATQTLILGAEAMHPAVALVTPTLVENAHNAGLRVNVWTANRWSVIRRLIDWGVDGIFSDYPARVIITRATLAAGQDLGPA